MLYLQRVQPSKGWYNIEHKSEHMLLRDELQFLKLIKTTTHISSYITKYMLNEFLISKTLLLGIKEKEYHDRLFRMYNYELVDEKDLVKQWEYE